jgi:predicted ATPase
LYVKNLTIQNFRCFSEAKIELNYPGRRATARHPSAKRDPNVNLFLGDNASGKSSVFRALTLGVLAPVISSSGLQADYLVRREPDAQPSATDEAMLDKRTAKIRATIHLDTVDTDLPESENHDVIGTAMINRHGDVEAIVILPVDNEKLWNRIFFNDSPAFFIVGYGASRRTERPEGYSEANRSLRYRRVASLFEDQFGLVPFSYGYLQLGDLDCLSQARQILNGLLPHGVELTEMKDSEQRPLFNQAGTLLPFSALSDGYRAFIGWIWDLLYQIARAQSEGADFAYGIDLCDLPGVVIVDEIDLLLHPEWQQVVVTDVARAFPALQFLFSTHSPLVAGTLEAESIFMVEHASDGGTVVQQYRENIRGLTANQVLTSSYFGLSSTRAPDTGMLSDLARQSTTHVSVTDGAPPVSASQKQMLRRLMERSRKQDEAIRSSDE